MMKVLLFLFSFIGNGACFFVSTNVRRGDAITLYSNNKDNNNGRNVWNPFQEISDMISSFDDVVDDFLNKRMGNGEIFYGQRKYKPSGRENTTGRYNGMGMSDKTKIDMAREYKEEMMEIRRLREKGLKRDNWT